MATLGSTPSFNNYYFSDSGTSCGTAPDQVGSPSYFMPSAGWVTSIVFYASGDVGTTTLTGVCWDRNTNAVLGNGSGVSCGTGARSSSGQVWRTDNCGFFLPNGQGFQIGWVKPTGGSMVWATNGSGGGNWGYNGTVPGAFVNCATIGQPGAYINYNPISNPSATTNAATSVGSTTATLNGTVGDGGQNGSGDPNSSDYYFQYGTDPGLAGATSTSPVTFNGTGQAAIANITGLVINTTYYFRVIAVNDAGTTIASSILSFATLGLPNAPTLTAPANGNAQNAQSASVTFAWTYNTGGAGGGETFYALKLTTGGVDSWWNGTTLQGTEIYVAEATTKTIAAAILAPSVTYLWTVSSQDANGKGPYASVFTLISEGPPAAPTLQAPTSGTYVDMAGATPTFSWLYNPGNAVGGQTNFAIRQKIAGAGSYSYYNVGTSSWQGTIVWNAQTGQSFTFPSGKWIDGNTYNWSVATQDAGGQGAFASDFTVTAQAIPVVTPISPSGSIATAKPVVTWSATYGSPATETAYQVRTFSAAQYGAGGFNPATSAAADDSGAISSSSATSYQVQNQLPAGTSYRSYIQVVETGSEPSGFIAFSAYTVTLDLPPTPTLTAVATTDPTTGCPLIKLAAQSLINILSSVDASFESGIGSFVGTNAALAQSATQAEDGSFSLRLTASSAATMSALSGSYAVLPSTQYTAVAGFRAGSTGRTVTVGITWLTAALAVISTSTGTGVADVTTGWTQVSVTASSPSNAAFAEIVVTVTSPANTEIHYVDQVGLFPGSGTVWSAGGFSATAGIVILRSDGVYVRGASPANPASLSNAIAPDQAVVNDYEITPLVAYTYQALLQATGAQGLVQSTYSSAVGASVSTTKWWELDPTNPSSAVAAQPIAWNPSITEQSVAHQVLGQTTMNVISSAMMATDMTASMEVFDAPTYVGLMALATSQKTIFFSDPYGLSYYFRIAPGPGGMSSGMGNKAHDTQLLPSTAAAPHRTVNLTGIAQPRPAV
jgi:hypothetical protein